MNYVIVSGFFLTGIFAGFGLFHLKNNIIRKILNPDNISITALIKILNYDELERSEFIQKSRRSLTLAGFTLSSLSLLIGTNKNSISGISSMIQPLFIAVFLFFLSSRFSIEAQVFWEGLVAEILEYSGEFAIMFALGAFLKKEPSLQSISWLPSFMNLILVIFSIKAIFDLLYMHHHMKRRGDEKNE